MMKKNKIAREFQLDHDLLVRKLSENGYRAEWKDIPKSGNIVSGLIIFLEDGMQTNETYKTAPVYYPDLMLQEIDELPENIDEFTQYLIHLHEDCCKKFVKQPLPLMDRDYLLAHLSVILAPMDEPTSSLSCPCELADVKAVLCADAPEAMFGIPENLLKELQIKKSKAWNTAILNIKDDGMICRIKTGNETNVILDGVFDRQFVITRENTKYYGAEAILGTYEKGVIRLDRTPLTQIADIANCSQLILMPAGTQGIFVLPGKPGRPIAKRVLHAVAMALYQANHAGAALGKILSDQLSVYDIATDCVTPAETCEEV